MSAVMLFWMFVSLFQYTANYATTFVAQYTGAGRSEEIGPVIGQALWFSTISGIGFIALVPFAGPIVELVGHEESLQIQETTYFRWLCSAALPFLITAAGTSFYAGRGDTRSVLLINVVGLTVNSFWAYTLINGLLGFPRLGITGAGYSHLARRLGLGGDGAGDAAAPVKRPQVRERLWLEFRLQTPGPVTFISDYLKELAQPSRMAAFSLFLLFIGRIGAADLSATSIACTLNLVAYFTDARRWSGSRSACWTMS
jgi:MATE family multidrug resistance protein